ncbi:hypothetical protein V1291_000231 [Nitrobacteraceae bacterium AZCC 1564]
MPAAIAAAATTTEIALIMIMPLSAPPCWHAWQGDAGAERKVHKFLKI